MNNKLPFRHIVLALLTVAMLTFSACATSGSTNTAATPVTHASGTATSPANHLITGPITYVALGASDAVGVGSTQPGSQGYVPLLATRLPKGSHLVNLGISGIHLHGALTEELPIALTTSPELVTIWLVANDFVGGVTYSDYMHDLNTLLEQLRTHTHASLVMANLPDLTRLPAFANQTATQKAQMLQQIQHWNVGIATLARQYNVTLVDLYSHGSQLTAHPEYISGDGFHPSPAGYVQLADIFWQAINV
ncbi:MAG TPA: GDSL-type esterase/lipase family protein [Ktedonobacteraceae bacterium]|nr:GDSL-type esterase/lipase family protein [Ktedonobacteraceae bacterium]